jgi:hypothetical protein
MSANPNIVAASATAYEAASRPRMVRIYGFIT